MKATWSDNEVENFALCYENEKKDMVSFPEIRDTSF